MDVCGGIKHLGILTCGPRARDVRLIQRIMRGGWRLSYS